MKIHEFQAKTIFRKYGIPVPEGALVESPGALDTALASLRGDTWVVKAQIHAGGRGQGGGVKVVKGQAACREAAKALLGKRLVTRQTGAQGREVRKLLVEEGLAIARELYLAVTLDRSCARGVVIASPAGGMSIEEIAASRPEKILKRYFDAAFGLAPFEARETAFALSDKFEEVRQLADVLQKMAAVFTELDCSLVEINPLIVTEAGKVIALDAKIDFDDNGLFRHAELKALRDPLEEDPREDEAKKYGLSYVGMEGNVGCMVNGAGLAMATMDAISLAGGMPANFLDVGGGAKVDQVKAAFTLILRDPQVRAILVNIFGGIMKCDVIAEGIIQAVREIEVRVPLVVRLEGTNVEKGRELLSGSGISIVTAEGLMDAARKVVELARP